MAPRLSPGEMSSLSAQWQEGDVLAMMSDAADSLVLGRFGQQRDAPGPAYGHAEILIRGPDGRWHCAGISGRRVRSRPLDRVAPRLVRFAVYRLRRSESERARVVRTVKLWFRDGDQPDPAFDYLMQDEPGRRDRFYCVGFVNEMFRLSGLSPPFVAERRARTLFSDHLAELVGVRPEAVRTANAVRHNADYSLVSAWTNPSLTTDDLLFREQFADTVLTYYESGWRLAPAQGANLDFAFGRWLLGFPEVSEALGRLRAAIQLYAADTRATWERVQRRGMLTGLSRTEKMQLLERVFEKHRHRYFRRPAADGVPVAAGADAPR